MRRGLPSGIDGGLSFLAAKILQRAAKDLRLSNHVLPPRRDTVTMGAWEIPKMLGFDRPRDELSEFFGSLWFEWVCDAAHTDPTAFLEKMLREVE